MGRGRSTNLRTAEERAAIRREKFRLNVQAHRERQKQKSSGQTSKSSIQSKFRWIHETKWEALSSVHQAKSRNGREQDPGRKQIVTLLRVSQPSLLFEPTPEKQNTTALLGIFRSRLLPDRIKLPSPTCPEK
ncbi:uncharacterized protein Z518_08020 [Rhinocladiella mackenziei CBS 650.93]|uniref:Rhinocladiella mackenziei CBS 650.93 unplaced genomic scaffold supercont1.6, whole genome shotgun sequence n=1 Tax=Rhinocladiella mackenziei CBS 650.93 TaxID=1442369 RepID=A0A0D2IFP4_9EURO|nr:uncharacterized protein Z518_08020 [Rhinocladiella mackenziei CBS 650.93]KIX02081.1 hypothetical protein Z518_08020 [Rhinocladiella mackenziei CBS 650.93]